MQPPLDWQRVARDLAGATLGRRLVYLDSTPSTNDVARDLGRAGEAEGVAVVADVQTAGRGRATKSPWVTPPYTSLALSVLLRPPLAPAALGRLGVAAGVAAVAAIREVAGVAARLKWPNDVVAPPAGPGPGVPGAPAGPGGPGKLGGILVESALQGDAVLYAVLGLGLNVNFPAAALGALPDAALPPATLLDLAGRPVSREDLLVALLRHLERRYAGLRPAEAGATPGPPAPAAPGKRATGEEVGTAEPALGQEYRAALLGLGDPVRLLDADRGVVAEGVAEDVTLDGALILRLPSGARRAFAYGELTLRPPG